MSDVVEGHGVVSVVEYNVGVFVDEAVDGRGVVGYDDLHGCVGVGSCRIGIGLRFFEEVIGGLIEKPQGKPTLVPEADKRVALDVRALRLNGDEFADTQETDDQ